VIEYCAKKQIFAPLKNDDFNNSIKYASEMNTKYVYNPHDTGQILSVICKKGKVGSKIKPEYMQALTDQYEGYRRQAVKLGFTNFDAELAFGAIVSGSCNRKINESVPWADTDGSKKKFLKIEQAAGRREHLSVQASGAQHRTHAQGIKLSDVLKSARPACPDNNPSKNTVRHAESVVSQYARAELQKIEHALNLQIARKTLAVQELRSKQQIAVHKKEMEIEKLVHSAQQKTMQFKAKLTDSLGKICIPSAKSPKTQMPF
jgi:hypothetical protein